MPSQFNPIKMQAGGAPMPYISGISRLTGELDPLSKQLLFGLGGRGGFIPGAMRAAERTFYDADGNPVVIDQQVADLEQDQLAASDRGLESLGLLRDTYGAYDQGRTQQFMDPYEDAVVQQTISDVLEQGDLADIRARAGDIGRGGLAAFGSRARLGGQERAEAIGRGLGEAISGIRSRGFGEAQRLGIQDFMRQQEAKRFGVGSLMNLGQYGMQTGGMRQQQQQNVLDAQRANAMQRQQTPLMQYQSLLPFIQTVPTSRTQTTTGFAPKPSALQTALGTGLSAFGGIGSLLKPSAQTNYNYGSNRQNQQAQQAQQAQTSPAVASTFNPSFNSLKPYDYQASLKADPFGINQGMQNFMNTQSSFGPTTSTPISSDPYGIQQGLSNFQIGGPNPFNPSGINFGPQPTNPFATPSSNATFTTPSSNLNVNSLPGPVFGI